MNTRSIWWRYGFFWVTLVLFLGSLIGHWTFAWFAYVNEQKAHQQPIEVSEYVVQTARDTFENWQSEFLQLIWQVGGLAFLWYIGSPQSKEEERNPEMLQWIVKKLDPQKAEEFLKEMEEKYPKK